MISTILNQFFCLQEKIHWNKSLGIIIVLPVGLEVTSLHMLLSKTKVNGVYLINMVFYFNMINILGFPFFSKKCFPDIYLMPAYA
jgi:hypothetical protein